MDARLIFDEWTFARAADGAELRSGHGSLGDRRPVLDDAKAVIPSAAIAAFTGVSSMIILWQAGMAKEPVRLTYVGGAVTVIQFAILAWAATELWRSARLQEPNPARVLAARLRDRLLLLALPMLVLPLFLASYTINKTGIAFLVGFSWDEKLANIDAAVFGTDPWRITHAFIGPMGTRVLEFFYAIGWGVAFAFTAPMIALYGSVRLVGRFYLSLLLTWLIGGNLLAYTFASAGPFLAQHSTPSLAARFAPLRQSLDRLLPPDSLILGTQDYLSASIHQPFVISGGGVSAMPSMHIATVVIYALAARGTPWRSVAVAMIGIVFVGSIHFGFHYASDALVGGLVAWLAWLASGCWFSRYRDAPGILAPKTGRFALPIG